MLGLSPLQTATVQSAILSLASSFLARLLTPDAPPPPLLALFIFTLLSTPPNYLWQGFLERRLPGYTSDVSKIKVDDDGQGVTIEKKLNVRNTVTKVLVDQTLGAAVNTIAWLMGVRALRGASLEECTGLVKEDFWPIMIAGYKVWPLVSLLNFTVVPVEKRVVVGSLVGLGWGVYLALRVAGQS